MAINISNSSAKDSQSLYQNLPTGAGKATRFTLVTAAGVWGAYCGQGLAVRVGSNFIYDSATRGILGSTPYYLHLPSKWIVAPLIANTSVGAAAPWMMAAGGIAGGLSAAALARMVCKILHLIAVRVLGSKKCAENEARSPDQTISLLQEPPAGKTSKLKHAESYRKLLKHPSFEVKEEPL